MIATTPSMSDVKPRDVQVTDIAQQTIVLRSRTWERLKFEVEYARQRGTTANSYLIQADKIALLDPPGESFTPVFLPALKQHIALTSLDYIILNHLNSNRLATLKQLLAQTPQATLICSKPAANLLKEALPGWAEKIEVVRGDETLDLGQGHKLQFIAVPTPRWADGLCTIPDKLRRRSKSQGRFGKG
ncbi:MAG: FprA family A-type flavoprotein [Leptolyngbyaceae cyanobacterium bins.59]|nr:FprA family A-type flavoprotein [Leptolyngbyaceae cyanobacterium bins.59]